jgi:Acetyltransferase (GNAT) domain
VGVASGYRFFTESIDVKLIDKAKALKSKLTERSAERKLLRSSAKVHYALADRIDALNPDVWQRAAGHSGFFFSRDYLKMLEAVAPNNIELRYALISDENNAPIAAVVMQLVRIGIDQVGVKKTEASEDVAKKSTKRLFAPIKEKLSERVTQTVLVCGNMLTYGQHGVAFALGIDQSQAWHAVAEVLYRTRQAERIVGRTDFILIKDMHAPFVQSAKRLEQLSYRYIETEPNMVLKLDTAWKNYDDYLSGLASKYRANVKNGVFKPIDAAGCVIERVTDVTPFAARIHALYRSVQASAQIRPFLLPESYFPTLLATAGGRIRFSLLKRGEEILGFLVSLADGETAIAYHIGFDKQAAETLPIYLRLLHAGVEDAISLGCRRISYGRTALAPKAALGAKPEAFGVLVRHRQPVLNKLIKRMLLSIEHEDAPERNPFKTAKVDAE